MQTSYFLMILVFTITTLGIIIQLPVASSDDFGGITQLHAPRPDLTKISLSLNDTFQQTSQNSTKDLHFRFFDANNNSTINNVTFFINATKDGKVLMHDLFYTSTGSITLKFYPDNDTEKWIVNGTNEPTLGGWMSKNDTLHIQGPEFTEGKYHIHVEVLSLFYVNELADQSNPPKFDSWWSIDEKGNISKYDNSVISFGSATPSVKIKDESPLKQFKSGIASKDVKCKQGLQLIFKFEDSSPACVTQQTGQILVERWWGMYVPAVTEHGILILSNSIKVQNTNFTMNYNISGHNKLLDANMDSQSKSLILSLNTTNNGTLIVSLPREMIDAKLPTGNDDKFYVLVNGQESVFKEINTTIIDRTISISFANGTHVIEIIGAQII